MSSDFHGSTNGSFGPHEVTMLREVHERLLTQCEHMLKDADLDQVARLVLSTYAEVPGDVDVVLASCVEKLVMNADLSHSPSR